MCAGAFQGDERTNSSPMQGLLSVTDQDQGQKYW